MLLFLVNGVCLQLAAQLAEDLVGHRLDLVHGLLPDLVLQREVLAQNRSLFFELFGDLVDAVLPAEPRLLLDRLGFDRFADVCELVVDLAELLVAVVFPCLDAFRVFEAERESRFFEFFVEARVDVVRAADLSVQVVAQSRVGLADVFRELVDHRLLSRRYLSLGRLLADAVFNREDVFFEVFVLAFEVSQSVHFSLEAAEPLLDLVAFFLGHAQVLSCPCGPATSSGSASSRCRPACRDSPWLVRQGLPENLPLDLSDSSMLPAIPLSLDMMRLIFSEVLNPGTLCPG